jgi:hypothetical protein
LGWAPLAATAGPAGGKRLVPRTDVPGDFGRFAIFTDPDGNQAGCGAEAGTKVDWGTLLAWQPPGGSS